MKVIIPDYTFNAASKTITFSAFSSIDLERVLVITNVTSNVMIYNFVNPAMGGTVSGNVLTLTYNTTSMSNTDRLQIYYDYQESATDDIVLTLNKMAAMMGFPDSAGRYRVITDSSSAMGTITALSRVDTTTNNPANQYLAFLTSAPENTLYATAIRPLIKVN